MEKITSKIAALPPDSAYFSLEFFPPKTAMGFSNLRDRLDRMSRALRPLFVSVTWGAGGSTAQKSLELAELTQRELGLTTCLHLTCTNMNRRLIDKALDDARALGVRNILALRGDPPRRDEYRDENFDEEDGEEEEEEEEGEATGEGQGQGEDQTRPREPRVRFNWAVDLVRYIRRRHGDYFCIGVSAYPEGHAAESHPAVQSLEADLPYLVEKVRAGADFIMTQLFFDVDAYDALERTLRAHPSGAFPASLPIIPGLMPVQSYAMIKRTAKLSHARMPDHFQARLDALKGDDEKVKLEGVEILAEMVERVAQVKSRTPGPRGFHFYTLNLEKSVSFILERTKLIPPGNAEDDDLAVAPSAVASFVNTTAHLPEPAPATAAPPAAAATTVPRPQITVNGGSSDGPSSHSAALAVRRASLSAGAAPHDRVIVSGASGPPSHPAFEATALEASLPAGPVNTRANTLAISEGEGALGREATWDDFPNGRWGDARSPAYGEIDGYGVSLHVGGAAAATRLWGAPRRRQDVDALFARYVRGDLAAIPWSEEELRGETGVIRDRLLGLIERKGWWTVASQPAVNGLRSDDATFGWGPRGGFVFQKAFVEFFLPAADWARLRAALDRDDVRDAVCWYAANAAGEYASSDLAPAAIEAAGDDDDDADGNDDGDGGEAARPRAAASTNAVTWGTFPGKEIVTPTIIEEVSFRAWCEEAFGIWAEWAKVYGRGSETEAFLTAERQDAWLVNVIHHEFVDGDALWELLEGV